MLSFEAIISHHWQVFQRITYCHFKPARLNRDFEERMFGVVKMFTGIGFAIDFFLQYLYI